jgi:hypothetical protein
LANVFHLTTGKLRKNAGPEVLKLVKNVGFYWPTFLTLRTSVVAATDVRKLKNVDLGLNACQKSTRLLEGLINACVRQEDYDVHDFLLLQFMYVYYCNLCHTPVLNLFYN